MRHAGDSAYRPVAYGLSEDGVRTEAGGHFLLFIPFEEFFPLGDVRVVRLDGIRVSRSIA